MRLRFASFLLALTLTASCAQPAATSSPRATSPPAVAAVAVATASSTNHSWTLTSGTPAEPLGPGRTYTRQSLQKTDLEDPARSTLHLVRFDRSRYTLKVIDQGNTKPGRYANLAEAMEQNACIAGSNGGGFHPDFRPAGLVVADGKRINKFETAKLLNGLLLVDSKGLRLLRRAEFEDHSGISQLLQSGPFLVDRDQTVSGLSNSLARTRVFVANNGQDEWAIGYCTRVSLADLGDILADPALLDGFKISRALNLDGGSSTSFYF